MEWSQAVAVLLAGIFSGFLTVTAGAAVTVVFPVLIAAGLSADAANATSRFSLAIGGTVAAAALVWRRQVDWHAMAPWWWRRRRERSADRWWAPKSVRRTC